jgi:hypothetical protein
MLRFSYLDSDAAERWIVCGHLSGPWVDELRSFWRGVRVRAPGRGAVVDLRDVTFIDEAGECLLAEMHNAGATFLASGVEHKYLIENLRADGKPTQRRRIEHLCGGRQ